MTNLEYELKNLTYRYPEGSYGTQAYRRKALRRIAKELHQLGFRNMNVRSLKPKHVQSLVTSWQQRELSTNTIKQQMSQLRWWAEKIRKNSVIPKRNAELGIPRRNYVATRSQSITMDESMFATIKVEWLRYALRLQQEFGLRREEAMKFRASYAIQSDHIRLKGSWCKGGRPRVIPICTSTQRQLLDEVASRFAEGSLIPSHLSYKQATTRYMDTTYQAGWRQMHGLRHGYAERRYEALTGWPPPVLGGPHRKELPEMDLQIDTAARLKVARELGHNRINITYVYLGN